jgi:hypothetical protein
MFREYKRLPLGSLFFVKILRRKFATQKIQTFWKKKPIIKADYAMRPSRLACAAVGENFAHSRSISFERR